jgi:hypothetical protein
MTRPDSSTNLDTICQIDLSEEQLARLGGAEEFLFVYGFIKYRSFFGLEHETRFCGKWVDGVFVWDTDTPHEYIKST